MTPAYRGGTLCVHLHVCVHTLHNSMTKPEHSSTSTQIAEEETLTQLPAPVVVQCVLPESPHVLILQISGVTPAYHLQQLPQPHKTRCGRSRHLRLGDKPDAADTEQQTVRARRTCTSVQARRTCTIHAALPTHVHRLCWDKMCCHRCHM